MSNLQVFRAALVLTFLAFALPQAGSAQDAEPAIARNRLNIFGHFTQAVGTASGLPVAGIPVGMTTDLRSLALQFRYQTSTNGQAILQFSHRREGHSAVAQVTPEVEVDWAYYRHRLGNLVLQAGRFPKPFGLYNDVLDVGTILPFYRATHAFYPDGAEVVEGVGAKYDVQYGAWGLEAAAYAGGSGYRGLWQTPNAPVVVDLHIEKKVGGRLWMTQTPLEGVQFGVSMLAFEQADNAPTATTMSASVAAQRGRLHLNAEWIDVNVQSLDLNGYYVQGEVDVTPRLSLVAQLENVDETPKGPYAVPTYNKWHDRVIGLNYDVSSSVRLKLEGHSARGFAFDQFVPTAGTGRYGIASISVSF